MALAILELLAIENANVRFSIDTGTNRYYQLKVGRGTQRRHGIDWVDEIYFVTPMAINEAGGNLLNSTQEIVVPASSFDPGKAYVQLFSFKTPSGKSPAFSRVVLVPMGLGSSDAAEFDPNFASAASMKITESFRPARAIQCRSRADRYARQASLEDLLASIVKAAGPAVLSVLAGSRNNGTQTSSAGSTADPANLLALLLKTILGGVPGLTGGVLSGQQSAVSRRDEGNRFFDAHNPQLSRPFVLPAVLGALLPSLAGPIIQALPELLNAANEKRLQMKQADNKLISDILSDVDRRQLIDQLLEAQHEAAADAREGTAANLNQLLQLLQQLPTAPAQQAPTLAPAPVAKVQSLSAGPSAVVSNRAVVSFIVGPPASWNGMPKALFAKDQALQLKIRLDVAGSVPKTALPRAIVKITFKDAAQAVLHEKTFKEKNVLPNSVMTLPFLADELTHLPANEPIVLLAQMRWLSAKTGKEHQALGASELVLVPKYFLKERGQVVSAERELTDMNQYRPFWNKVWEAPPLDAANGSDNKKYLWELDVNAKYAVLLSADHDANGLMETKILRGPADYESIGERTEGRMKAGIELSVTEMSKLASLWDSARLDGDKLAAFKTEAFAKDVASEFMYRFKLKGRAGERGMIWVVPTFKLVEFTLNAVQATDEAGQVTSVVEEKVRFPLPASARVIGLKSKS